LPPKRDQETPIPCDDDYCDEYDDEYDEEVIDINEAEMMGTIDVDEPKPVKRSPKKSPNKVEKKIEAPI
jgi:hypothetical protein